MTKQDKIPLRIIYSKNENTDSGKKRPGQSRSIGMDTFACPPKEESSKVSKKNGVRLIKKPSQSNLTVLLLAANLHFLSKIMGQRWSLELIYLPRVETQACLPAKAGLLINRVHHGGLALWHSFSLC
ncbi:MAG: hypothetical protein NXH89_13345 [Cyclobacteriaceae bacterium]|nr:hypothetical protein [Cyclobacteriaceae bacterium]